MLRDLIEGTVESVTGTVGLGLLVLAGGALLATRGGRPAAKGAIRGWFAGREKAAELSDTVRSFVAETGERIQDLYAEAQAEVRADGEPAPASA